jgi:hypothetical protein
VTAVVDPASLVDLDRYPILDLEDPGALQVVASVGEQLAATGAAELGGFVTDAGLRVLIDDADALTPLAHRSGGPGTAYLAHPDLDQPSDHPTRWLGDYAVGAVAYDLFPPDSPLRRLYEWTPLMRFVEACLDRGELFPYADSMGALNLAVMGAGDQLQWHFDQTDFVVSLALRDADVGGDFEVVPRIRSADEERYETVACVLGGSSTGIVRLPMTPGTLLIFEGRHSIHRVSPIAGPTTRLVGLLGYDTKPGTSSTELLRMTRYGRNA